MSNLIARKPSELIRMRMMFERLNECTSAGSELHLGRYVLKYDSKFLYVWKDKTAIMRFLCSDIMTIMYVRQEDYFRLANMEQLEGSSYFDGYDRDLCIVQKNGSYIILEND